MGQTDGSGHGENLNPSALARFFHVASGENMDDTNFRMANPTSITPEALQALYSNHPYLLIFQKEDWQEYVQLIAQIYTLLEGDTRRLPFEAARTEALKFYSQKTLANMEQKVHSFFSMAIAELSVLRDSHDVTGQRYIETTRYGKMLLQMISSLIVQKVKFSGTGAETLLGALNAILASRKEMTRDEAINHHKEKLSAYREDLRRIEEQGVAAAELLPIPHSNEALFSQAEEAAQHILQAIEDVKAAIEEERRQLAENYFEQTRSAGQSLAAVADFYERLFATEEYRSYNQAKQLLSHIDSLSARFASKNVDHLLHSIAEKELLPPDNVKASQLRGFMNHFGFADTAIQEKVKAQIRLLQQQVQFAITSDVHSLQQRLHECLASLVKLEKATSDFFTDSPLTVELAAEFDVGPVDLFAFEISENAAPEVLQTEELNEDEQRAFFLALLQAEETTLQMIIESFLAELRKRRDEARAGADALATRPTNGLGGVHLRDHVFRFGLAEYYVLSQIELFTDEVHSQRGDPVPLCIDTKFGQVVVPNVPDQSFYLIEPNTEPRQGRV